MLDDPAALDARTRRAVAENRPAADGPEAGATGGTPSTRAKAIRDLGEKIHGGAWRVTEADIAAVRAAGLSEDEVFDLVVAASVGAAKMRLDAAMGALAAATPARKKVSG